MSNEINNKIVPKLRFPEFKESVEWEEKTFGEITFPVGERNKEKKDYPVYSINNVSGFLPQSDQFEGVDSNNRGYDTSLYKVVERKTFAYNPARINVGSIGYSGDLHNIIISSLYVCFKTTDEVEDLFLNHFLKTQSFNESVNQNVEGGIRSYLFYENLSRIKICLPKDKTEQRKIAFCLSSLDELIAAESRKLEALKAHKKGLMQQLFPAAGETVPKLRFAEFKDCGEWQEKRLEELCFSIASGKDKIDAHGAFDLYGSTGIIGKTSDGSYEGRFILVARVGANAGLLTKVDAKFGVTDNTLVISLKNGEDINFVYYSLEKFGLNKLIFGSGQPLITGGQLKNLNINYPQDPKEQQKIADCLSAADALITAQASKIEQLKNHKKGLMQGLFPNVNNSNSTGDE